MSKEPKEKEEKEVPKGEKEIEKEPKQLQETNTRTGVIEEKEPSRESSIEPFGKPGVTYDPNAPPAQGGQGGRFSNVAFIVLSAVIAFVIVFIMVPRLAPSRNAYEQDITRLELDLVDIRGNLGGLTNLPAGFTSLSNDVIGFRDSVIANSAGITVLETWATDAGARLDALETQPAPEPDNSLEYALTGTFGQYLLTIKASIGGDFVGKINLVYITPQPVGDLNATISEATQAFHTGWLTSPNREYIPVLKWDAIIGWKVTEVSFYTSKITLVADTEAIFNIAAIGLKTGVELTHHTYVEVFPLLTTTVTDGGGAA